MANKSDYIKALDALRKRGSIGAAASDLKISKSALLNRIRSKKIEPYDYTNGFVVGRNAGLRRQMLDGNTYSFGKPISTQIDIETIARGLSRIGYGTGQTGKFISVAAASCELSNYVLEQTKSPKLAFLAFLNYSHAAYIGYVHHSVGRKLTGNWNNFVRDSKRAIYDSEDLLPEHNQFKNVIDEYVSAFETIFDKKVSCQDSDIFNTLHSPRVDEPRFLRHYAGLKALVETLE